MATRLTDEFPARTKAPTAAYPDGSYMNETSPGANDGTPLDERIGDDYEGLKQSLLDKAGITPNGQPDSVTNPQQLQAVEKFIVDGDSQLAGGAIWPLSSQDSAQDGDDLTGFKYVRLSGGAFSDITQFPMVKKDGSATPLSGNLSNINLTTRPYSATVGSDDIWLLDIKYSGYPTVDFPVEAFWASGDGVTDDLPSFIAAKSVYKSISAGVGTFYLSDVFSMDDNGSFKGAGKDLTVLQFEVTNTFFEGALDVDNKSNVYLSDFSMRYGPTGTTSSYGLMVRGTSPKAQVERVRVNGFGANMCVAGDLSSTPGRVADFVCRDCIVEESIGTFGLVFNDSDRANVYNINAKSNWLDGLKIRKGCDQIKIFGGISHNNGVGPSNGNGIDCFAGGNEVLINGLECFLNDGAGILIKTGSVNPTPDGDIKRLSLVGCISHDNTNDGYQITRNSGSNPTDTLVSHVEIVGGRYFNNQSGGNIRGRNVTVNGGHYGDNQRFGLTVAQSLDVSISGASIVHNCLDGVTLSGLQIASSERVTVGTTNICGVDSNTIKESSDYDALTPTHTYSILIPAADCKDITIEESVEMSYNLSGTFIITGTPAAGSAIICHQKGTTNPEGVIYGTTGSTYKRVTSTSIFSQNWVKTSDTVNTDWLAMVPKSYGTTAQRPTSPETMQEHVDTTIKKPVYWSGTQWIDAVGNPA